MDHDVIAKAADWHRAVQGFCDDDVDLDDDLAVVLLAYTSSDCDDFSFVLAKMTGWPVVRASWQVSDWGHGHHSLVRSPDGRLLDAAGWTDEAAVKARYLGRRKIAMVFAEVPEPAPLGGEDDLERTATVIAALPLAPFDGPAFRAAATGEWRLEGSEPCGPVW